MDLTDKKIYNEEIERYKSLGLKYSLYYDNKIYEIGNLTEHQLTGLLNKFLEHSIIFTLPPRLVAEMDNIKDYLITLRREKIIKIKDRIKNV